MPDNDFDSDAMLAFFGQLGKEIDAFKVKIVSLDEAGNAMKKMTDHTERFGQTIERHTRGTVRGMQGGLTDIIGLVRGPAGLALAIAGAALALDKFAVGQLQLRNFATNTGFGIEGIKNMRVQLSAAGMSASEAASGIGNMGAKLQEVLALQETSGFYRSLQASSPAMAEQVRQLMNAGKQQEALNVLQEAYNKGGERFKAWLPTVTGVSRAAWEAQRYGMEGLLKPWSFLTGDAEKYHKMMVNLGTIFDGVWTSMTYTVLEGLVKLTGSEGLEGLNEKAKKFADNFKAYFDDRVIPALKDTFKEAQDMINWFRKQAETRDFGQGGRLRPEEFIRRQNEDEQSKNFSSWDWIKKQLGIGEDGDGAELPKNAKPRSFSPESVVDTDKDTNRALRDMRDIFAKWDDELEATGTGAAGSGFGPGGGAGMGGSGGGGGGGTGAQSAGGPAGLNDEGGKKIDADTMKQAEMLGRAGDVAGLQRLFAQKGYKMSGPACGIVASGYVKSAGFKPPPGGAIATSWHKWGEGIKDPNDINAPGRTFGSMVGTYWHGRYGGTQGQILAPGQTGGHVMTIVPGTYDPKTGTVDMVDQYGYSHGKRSIKDIDLRFAGAEAVAAAEAAKGGDRSKIDKSLAAQSGWPTSASANINVNLNNVPPGVKANAEADGAFKTLKMSRNNQMAYE